MAAALRTGGRALRSAHRAIAGLAVFAATLVWVGGASFAAAPRVDLFSWRPGLERVEIESQLAAAKLRPIKRGAKALLVESPLLRGVFARQRALIEFGDGGGLESVTVHLVPDREDAGEELLRLYDDVRETLLRELGTPSFTRESGSLPRGQGLRVLADGSIVRCMEWQTAGGKESPGRIVRLGIPKSASSERRVEIRIAGSSLPPPDGFWGRDF